jgi:hypothetical protein
MAPAIAVDTTHWIARPSELPGESTPRARDEVGEITTSANSAVAGRVAPGAAPGRCERDPFQLLVTATAGANHDAVS